jgi:NADH:ubiquinone oxidoreductase subunit E
MFIFYEKGDKSMLYTLTEIITFKTEYDAKYCGWHVICVCDSIEICKKFAAEVISEVNGEIETDWEQTSTGYELNYSYGDCPYGSYEATMFIQETEISKRV